MNKSILLILLGSFMLFACSGETATLAPTSEPTREATSTPTQLPPPPTQDPEVCTGLVTTALNAVELACGPTGRNEVCYGNGSLSIDIQPDVQNISFAQPGDLVDINALRSITLSSLNTATDEWGIALMKLQANLAETLPGQNVTFLMFGDVSLEYAEMIDGVQAFYFQTGIGQAICAEAPDDGILIQSPSSTTEVAIVMNDIEINLNDTIYVQAQTEDDLAVNVLEGQAEVTVGDDSAIVSAGNRVTVADADAEDPISEPEPFVGEALQALPINNLERPVDIPDVELNSTFVEDVEGWTGYPDDSELTHVSADETSDGHICSTDLSTGEFWYFESPDDWEGDQSDLYGGMLTFVLKQSAIDPQDNQPDVMLVSPNITLHYDTAVNPDVNWIAYSILLDETAGWLVAGTSETPTADDMQDALASLENIRIRGAYGSGEDTGCLDSVQIIRLIEPTTPNERDEPYIEPTPMTEFMTDAIVINVGDIQAGNIEAIGEVHIYTFSLTSEQDIMFAGLGADDAIVWQLESNAGEIVFEREGLWFGNLVGPYALSEGDYSLQVIGQASTTGNYSFQIWEHLEPQSFTLEPGDIVANGSIGDGSGRIESPGAVDIYTLNLDQPADIYFAVLVVPEEMLTEAQEVNSKEWQLIDEAGTEYFSDTGMWFGNDPGVIPLDSGIYTLTVKAELNNTGIYHFRIWEMPEPQTFSIAVGDAISDGVPEAGAGHIEEPGAQDIYTLTIDTERRILFDALDEDLSVNWMLIDEAGSVLFNVSGMWENNDPGTYTLAPGIYTITIWGRGDETGAYRFQVTDDSS